MYPKVLTVSVYPYCSGSPLWGQTLNPIRFFDLMLWALSFLEMGANLYKSCR